MSEPPEDRAHGFGVCHRCQDDPGAPQLHELHYGILRLSVNVMPRPELPGEGFFVLSPCNGDCPKPHFDGKLNAKMAEPSYSVHGDNIARSCPTVTERIKRRNSGTHEWRCLYGGKLFRKECDRTGWSDHIIGIAAVESDTGDLAEFTGKKI